MNAKNVDNISSDLQVLLYTSVVTLVPGLMVVNSAEELLLRLTICTDMLALSIK